jgi:hypothetical protein
MRGETLEGSYFAESLVDFELGGVEGRVVGFSRSEKVQDDVSEGDDSVD